MPEPDRHASRLCRRADAHLCDEPIFQPAPEAEKSEVVPVLEPAPQIAEETERALGILSAAQEIAQVEQAIHFIAGDRARFTEQFIDDLQRTTPPAGRWAALDRVGCAALGIGRVVVLGQFFRVLLSIQMVFS